MVGIEIAARRGMTPVMTQRAVLGVLLLAGIWLTPLASMAADVNPYAPARLLPPEGPRTIPTLGQLRARRFARGNITDAFHMPLRTTGRSRKIDPATGHYIPTQRERSAINQFWNHLNGQTGLHGHEHAQLYQEGTRNGVQGVH